jgi:hypothetical protein
MHHVRFITVLFALPATLLADDMTTTVEAPSSPSPYKMLRFDEDYSCLSNAANRSDWFDPIKYIPLRTNDPSWYLTLGGELRERFEGNFNPNFGIGGIGSDSYLLQRITLLADLHLGERVRFFAEGISGLMEGESPPAPPAQEDPIDLQFAFLDVVPYLTDDERLTLRAGRFGMSFGTGRLVDTRPPVNIDFRFDGFELLYSRPLWEATAFLTQPVRDSGSFNGEDHSTTFWGLYITHWFDAPHTLGLDFYYFGINRKDGEYASGPGDEHRHSLGAREFGEWNHWDWNAEEVLQVGSFGNDSILAWTGSLDSGYTWQIMGQPRFGLKADVASGDHNSTNGLQGTFDALYFKSGYFNDANLLRPENIIDLHPNASVRLTQTVSVDGGADFFWRYSRNDAIYAVPGSIAIPALRTESSYVGAALDVNLNWQIQRHVSFQASYVHFFSGDYVHAAGGRDLNYVSTTISFLF